MNDVLSQIRACNYCEEQLEFGARPDLAGTNTN